MYTILVLLSISVTTYPLEYGLQWGEECKIPGPKEFLKHTEECEMSKGLQCQPYRQGSLCGCLIRSSLSYDLNAGECRRKPGHHCPFINTTDISSTRAYKERPYNHKCHVNADCVLVDPIPEVDSSKTKSQKEHFAVCRCKPGFKESKDGHVCHNINETPSHKSSNILLLVTLLTFLTPLPT